MVCIKPSQNNPFGWLPTRRIGAIHWINVVGGGKQNTMVMMLVKGVVLMLDGILVIFLP